VTTHDIANNVFARRHVAFCCITQSDVYNLLKEVGFAVLAAEVPANDIVVVREMRFAALAAVDLVAIQVDIVCETHFRGIQNTVLGSSVFLG